MKKIILVSALLSLTGCYQQDTYDLKEVSGEAYLLNQETGSVAVVQNGRLIELQKLSLSTEKTLNLDSSIDQKLNIKVTAKQIEDRLFYNVKLSNYSASPSVKWLTEGLKENTYDRVILQFQDKDGFVLTDHTIDLSEGYTNMKGYTGETEGIVYEDSIRANPLLFSKVDQMSFVYAIQTLADAPEPN